MIQNLLDFLFKIWLLLCRTPLYRRTSPLAILVSHSQAFVSNSDQGHSEQRKLRSLSLTSRHLNRQLFVCIISTVDWRVGIQAEHSTRYCYLGGEIPHLDAIALIVSSEFWDQNLATPLGSLVELSGWGVGGDRCWRSRVWQPSKLGFHTLIPELWLRENLFIFLSVRIIFGMVNRRWPSTCGKQNFKIYLIN